MFFARWMRRDLRLKMPIDYHFLFLFIANSVPFVCTNNCHVWNMCVWLLRMYPLTARYVPFDCHVCVCWLPGICLLNAIYVPFVCLNNCHIWATSMPVDCQVCASWLPFLYLLIATCGPVVCHIGASCLPHVAHMWARQRPHVGLTLASVAKRVWPTCVPYVGVISTATCGPCVAHLWNVCWVPSQHTNAVLRGNVLSSPKQFLLGMHSLKVWSLAPHQMHSRWHWGDRCQATVFEHTNPSCF